MSENELSREPSVPNASIAENGCSDDLRHEARPKAAVPAYERAPRPSRHRSASVPGRAGARNSVDRSVPFAVYTILQKRYFSDDNSPLTLKQLNAELEHMSELHLLDRFYEGEGFCSRDYLLDTLFALQRYLDDLRCVHFCPCDMGVLVIEKGPGRTSPYKVRLEFGHAA